MVAGVVIKTTTTIKVIEITMAADMTTTETSTIGIKTIISGTTTMPEEARKSPLVT